MPILRGGVTADSYYTPDIYIEEQELDIPEKPAGVSSKVMGIIGQFQRGSLHETIVVTGEKQFKEKLGGFLDKYPGSKAAFTAFKRGIKKLVLVNVRGAGATEASTILKTTDSKDWVKIVKVGPGLYSNDCLVEVVTTNGDYKVLLSHPDIKTEVYDSIKSGEELVKSINMLSKEYRAELVAEGTPTEVVNQAFEGGSDGTSPNATHYKGSTDSSTGKKTGLELMKTSIEVTDVVTDIFVSDIMNQALIKAAEDMNWYTYLPTAQGTNVANAISTRNSYDSEFGHLSMGWAKSKDKGWFVPVAVYDCVAHLLSLVQDGTAGFTFKDVESLDVELSADDFEALSKAQVVCMGQMLDNERNLVYGMKSDYTLSKDERYKQTYRRRVASLLENDLFIILNPYRSKHISKGMLEEVETITRKYFDDRITDEMIQAYQVSFTSPEQLGNIDAFIQDLIVDLYNIADKIRVRLLTAANAIQGVDQ